MAKTEKTVDCSSIEGKNGGESMKNNYEGSISLAMGSRRCPLR